MKRRKRVGGQKGQGQSALGAWAGLDDPRPVLVVGDLIYDHYVWGDVDRISPEAPVQVLRWHHEAEAMGGAANVAHNLASLGCPVRLIGVVGADVEGRHLRRLMETQGIDTEGVLSLPDRPTVRKMRVIAQNQHVLRIDREDLKPLEGSYERQLCSALKRLSRRARGIICSDYAKGVLTDRVLEETFSAAARAACPVLVDPKDVHFSRYRGADFITPNEEEVIRATARSRTQDKGALASRVRGLLRTTGAKAFLVTRGGQGMTLYGRSGGATHLPPAQTHEVYDVTGAGDTVAAIFGLAAFGGAPLAQAARLANVAAGLVVATVGTKAVGLSGLARALDSGLSHSAQKVLPLVALRERLDRARSDGQTVVFTNGCFDLLHTGHLYLLQRARALGHLLVVGLNDDASVRRLKGPGRPILPLQQRVELVAALRFVDYVVVFRERTPSRLIRALRPHVLVKGGDYEPYEVVGKGIVEAYGGRVEIIPLLPGFSTTGLMASLRNRGS